MAADTRSPNELQACTELIANIESEIADNRQHVSIDPQEQHDKETNLAVMREREIDLRVQLGMLLRQEIESMWEQEKKKDHRLQMSISVVLLEQSDCYDSRGPGDFAGALLIDSQNASARLNLLSLQVCCQSWFDQRCSVPHLRLTTCMQPTLMCFQSQPGKGSQDVPHDENYRLLRSYGGHDLPASAWLNSAVRRPGETKDALRNVPMQLFCAYSAVSCVVTDVDQMLPLAFKPCTAKLWSTLQLSARFFVRCGHVQGYLRYGAVSNGGANFGL